MSKPKEILRNLLLNIFHDKINYKDDVVIDNISTDGANYSSTLYKAVVKVAQDDGRDRGDDIRLFAKVASWAENVRTGMNSDAAFEVEKSFYTLISPAYKSLQNKYKIKKENRFLMSKFYGCNSSFLDEAIVLEDLTARGFVLHDRFEAMDWEYASKGVEELAKFHALSFVHKHENPKAHAENLVTFDWRKNVFLNMLEVFRGTSENVYKIVPEYMKLRFKTFVNEQLTEEMFGKYFGPGDNAVLVHGDYRASNIMHKRSKNGKVTSLIPVDYQTLHFGSPATDLLYFIFTGTDEYFRRHHLQNLIELYYETVTHSIEVMGLNPDLIFPREQFDKEYNEMLPFGLFTASFCLPVVLVSCEDAPKMDAVDADIALFSVKLSDEYKKRYLSILNEFAQLGIL